MRSTQLIELQLSIERVQVAKGEHQQAGVKFVKMLLFLEQETITTDRIQVTKETVRSLNLPSV